MPAQSSSQYKTTSSTANDYNKKLQTSFSIFAEEDTTPTPSSNTCGTTHSHFAFDNVTNSAAVGISSRPIRNGRGEIDLFAKSTYSNSTTNLKKQGVKRDRTSLTNVNTNTNCGNDDDTIRSDSTEENEFVF